MDLKTIFGVPTHPLVVHAVVVLLPLAALVVIGAARPRWRKVAAPVAFGLALASTAAVLLAEHSGEQLEHAVPRSALVRAHTRGADAVLPWALLVTAVAGAATFAEPATRRLGRSMSPRVLTIALLAGSVVAGAGATYTVIDVGHSGAEAVWHDTYTKGNPDAAAVQSR